MDGSLHLTVINIKRVQEGNHGVQVELFASNGEEILLNMEFKIKELECIHKRLI